MHDHCLTFETLCPECYAGYVADMEQMAAEDARTHEQEEGRRITWVFALAAVTLLAETIHHHRHMS
jgi:hypothetical protein